MNNTQKPKTTRPGRKNMTKPARPSNKEIQNVTCFGGVSFIFLSFYQIGINENIEHQLYKIL